MNAVIWGANGQDGFYLSELLRQQGLDVVALGRTDADISNYDNVAAIIKKQQPGYLFHLAANSTTRHSAGRENHDTIATGSFNILEAVKEFSPATRVFLSGSGLQFRNTGDPINEQAPFDATSLYAASRIYSTYLARYYRKLGVKAYMGYFFNHDSPRRSERHINKKIIEAAKKIAAGSGEKLEIGDVEVKKEFGFAGDIVKAVWTLVQQDNVHEAVIGTGKAYSIADWLHICFSKYGLNWKDHVTTNSQYIPEYKILVSDPATIFSLGWRPEVDIEGLANLMEA